MITFKVFYEDTDSIGFYCLCWYYLIPEQFTVKANPALLRGEPKNEALLFQSM